MSALFFVLPRILFPLDPVARLREVTRDYLSELIGYIEDPLGLEELKTLPEARACLEAEIITAEHGVHLLIHERARQILGLPFIFTPRLKLPVLRKVKPLKEILARFRNTAILFDNLERLAQRRAGRLRAAMEQNPLRLAPPAQSTSPSLRLVEANHNREFAVPFASLSPKDWGRWHACSRTHDGGGRALPRGPPAHHARLPIIDRPLPRKPRFRGRIHIRRSAQNLGNAKVSPLTSRITGVTFNEITGVPCNRSPTPRAASWKRCGARRR